jgi:Domain of unknown function (DUF4386)
MERSSREWLVPLTGIAFFILLVVSFIIIGEPKDADHPPQEVAQWYLDNKDAAEIGAFVSVVAAGFLIFFGAYLRKVLDAAAGGRSMLAVLPLVGLAIVGVGAAIDNMLIFVAAEAADDIPAPEIQTIQAIWDNDFLPLFLGVLVFNWSVGLAVLQTGALPKWLGWLAIVAGVVSLAGPIGFFGALLAALWIIIASILLSMRARQATAPPPAAAAPPAA